MSGPKPVRLGEYFRIKHGYAFKGEHFCDDGPHIVTTPGNFHAKGGLKRNGEKEKRYSGIVPNGFMLEPGDLIVAMTDLKQSAPILGASALITDSNLFLHNQRIGKIVELDEGCLDRIFLFYLFNWEFVRKQLRATATGATVRHTAPERIYDVRVSLPPLPIQRRIASILSAYDDLIENNTKRIKILEEMARALYREWFVHFRFPGHEKVGFADSSQGQIPAGWKATSLGQLTDVNREALQKESAPDMILYVDIRSVSTGTIDNAGRMPFCDAPSRARRIVRDGDVIWSTVRPNRRSYALVLDPEPNLVVSTGFAVLSPRMVPSSYLYFATTQDSFVAYLVNHARGAAYPAVNGVDFESAPALLPGAKILDAFDEIVCPMLRLRHFLQAKNRLLRQTRDLLLPRLISGDLDVSTLPIPIPLPIPLPTPTPTDP